MEIVSYFVETQATRHATGRACRMHDLIALNVCSWRKNRRSSDARKQKRSSRDTDKNWRCLFLPGTVVEYVWNVMAHAQKPDLVFRRNGRVHLNWRGGGRSVQSTAGSRGVRISGSNGSNAGYTVFWGRVQDYWLPTPLACFPFTSPTVRHRLPSGFNWALPP